MRRVISWLYWLPKSSTTTASTVVAASASSRPSRCADSAIGGASTCTWPSLRSMRSVASGSCRRSPRIVSSDRSFCSEPRATRLLPSSIETCSGRLCPETSTLTTAAEPVCRRRAPRHRQRSLDRGRPGGLTDRDRGRQHRGRLFHPNRRRGGRTPRSAPFRARPPSGAESDRSVSSDANRPRSDRRSRGRG